MNLVAELWGWNPSFGQPISRWMELLSRHPTQDLSTPDCLPKFGLFPQFNGFLPPIGLNPKFSLKLNVNRLLSIPPFSSNGQKCHAVFLLEGAVPTSPVFMGAVAIFNNIIRCHPLLLMPCTHSEPTPPMLGKLLDTKKLSLSVVLEFPQSIWPQLLFLRLKCLWLVVHRPINKLLVHRPINSCLVHRPKSQALVHRPNSPSLVHRPS